MKGGVADALTRRVLLLYLAMDLAFKGAVVPAFFTVLHGDVPAAPPLDEAKLAAAFSLPLVALWLAAVARALRPVILWLRAPDPGAAPAGVLARAGARLQVLPRLLAVLWACQWFFLCAGMAVARGAPLASWSMVMFLGAMATGPLPLAYILGVTLLSPSMARLSVAARAARVEAVGPATSLRGQMLLFSLCLAVAPSLYMASVAFAARRALTPLASMHTLVLLFLAGIALFAVLCAVMFASSMSASIALMADVIGKVGERGDVARVERLPSLRRDELGALAEHTNVMIDRLEKVEADRAAAAASLAALNQTLEERVTERTLRLSQANESLAAEMKARLKMELELRQAQKLESVGRLAAGVAHEINTPIQFVGDSLQFLGDAMRDLATLIELYRTTHRSLADGAPVDTAIARAAEAEEQADAAYLLEQVPSAIERSVDGIGRVATIVSSLKQFAHPEQKEMAPVDLNQAVQSTLTIARNEWKYVADLETDFGELPPVVCHGGDVNQAVLNIVVNAAHAIGDVVAGTDGRGRITVRTRRDGDAAVLTIADTGGGIPLAVRDHIFEPFFTTKEVGKGTGQGLAIARSVVEERHAGRLTFETELGRGTTFTIRLPIDGRHATASRPN